MANIVQLHVCSRHTNSLGLSQPHSSSKHYGPLPVAYSLRPSDFDEIVKKSKKGGKDQETIQSRAIPDRPHLYKPSINMTTEHK